MKKFLKILLIIVLILALVMGAGFCYMYSTGRARISRLTEPEPGQIKVACVGDSITYGSGTTNWPKNAYPTVPQELLGQDYHVNNYAIGGRAVQADSDYPYTQLSQYQKSLEYQADILVFMMGTNDAKTVNWKNADAFRKDLEALLDSYGQARTILCTPAAAFFPDGQTEGVTSFDIQPEAVDQIAQITRDVAQERQIPLVDIHGLSLENEQWFEKDGVHPNNDGAAAIAQAVYQAIHTLE